MEDIPTEITSEILSRIDVGSVLPSKQVSTAWRAFFSYINLGVLFSITYKNGEDYVVKIIYTDFDKLINSDTTLLTDIPVNSSVFTKIPLVLYSPIVQEDPVIGSCNGLVCCIYCNRREPEGGGDGPRPLTTLSPILILNPVTREYVKLQGLVNAIQGTPVYVAAGFGYHRSANEYKVVTIYDEYTHNVMHLKRRVRKAWVYTLGGGGGWRYIADVHYTFNSSGIHANGFLYWVDYNQVKIIAFDLGDEEFHSITTPPEICLNLSKKTYTFRLRVLGGYVCLVHQKPGICVDVWSLKRMSKTNSKSCKPLKKKNKTSASSWCVRSEKGTFWIWSKEFSITWVASCKDYDLITITKSNVVLLRCNLTTICCYDLRTEILSKLWEDDPNSTIFNTTPHMNTSISLKDLEEDFGVLPDPYKGSI